MRSVTYLKHGGPEVLELLDESEPAVRPGEFLIDVHAVSVNPVDWKIRSGLISGLPPRFPASTGRDGAGIVRAAGDGTEKGLVGSRVCFLAPRGTGTWTDVVSLPPESVARIPDNLSFSDAAGLPLAGISAWTGLVQTGKIKAGQRVLIHGGSGGVGSIAVQLARHFGAHVSATSSMKNVEYVRNLGAHQAVPYDDSPFEAVVGKVDLVFDLVGGEAHRRSYEVLKPGGTLVYLNAAPIEDRAAEFGVHLVMAEVFPDSNVLSNTVAFASSETFHPVVHQRLPFEEFQTAQALAQSGHRPGKIVVNLRD